METNTKHRILGHIGALTSIVIWAITFISTKILLEDFSPVEILFFRFIFAWALLFILSPKPIWPKRDKTELFYAVAGLCGVTFYFLFQNIGLSYTLASNAGVIIAVAPMFTAVVSYFLVSRIGLSRNFIIGFFVTMAGVIIINFNGNFVLNLNPLGDILIILGALSWAFYCNILILINNEKLSLIRHTRKVFFYGLLFMIPVLLFADFQLGLERLAEPQLLGNILFLAFGASATAFLSWNYAVGVLGSVKTATYIYFSPIVTVIASVIILSEPLTWISVSGTVLIILGLVVSERKSGVKTPPDSPDDTVDDAAAESSVG